MAEPTRPIGHSTRGKTTRNRLRRVDIFLIRYAASLIKRQEGNFQSAYYVDLGFGEEPHTTIESSNHFKKLNPHLPVLGVEIAPERIAAAKPYEDELVSFRLGGFNLPLGQNEHARLIRAFNVLRQYEEEEIAKAYETMQSKLLPGGLIIEGTSDPFGRIWTANLVRKSGEKTLDYEGLVLSTNFRWGFDPVQLQTVLPKNLIHHLIPGETIYQFFSDWKDSAKSSIGFKKFGLRQWFQESAHQLAAKGYQIDLKKKFLRSGFLVWKNPALSLIKTPE